MWHLYSFNLFIECVCVWIGQKKKFNDDVGLAVDGLQAAVAATSVSSKEKTNEITKKICTSHTRKIS